jgi:hypothetical protein
MASLGLVQASLRLGLLPAFALLLPSCRLLCLLALAALPFPFVLLLR